MGHMGSALSLSGVKRRVKFDERWSVVTRTSVLVVAAALMALAMPPAAAAEQQITKVERPTEIRSWQGIGAFSVYDSAAGVYRLAITRAGGKPEFQPVPPRPVPFDADVGPDTRMQPAIVYSRCATEAPNRRDCDIYRYSIARGVEARIRNADSDVASEFNPTIWKGRVAWVRTYDRRPADAPFVYTRELTAPRSRRSKRLPAIPTRRCSEVRKGCSSTRDGRVEGLELWGRWLALNVTYSYEGVPGICGRKEVRLDTLGGQVRQIADQICGLGGQSYVGLSFEAGRLYWARYCAGDPGACAESNSGAFRYRLSTGEFGLAGFVRKLTGFSYVTGDRAYEVRVRSHPKRGECGNPLTDAAPECEVVLTDPLSFRQTSAPR